LKCESSDYQVIKLETLLSALKPNADDPGIGQTRRPIARQQREQ
jgi:hypothetical protein